MRYNLHSKLPDYYLEPPPEDEREWDQLTWCEKVERLTDLPKEELIVMYMDLLENQK